MKQVLYYCFGCRCFLLRSVMRATKFYKSYCNQVGKTINMRKARGQ